MMTDKEIIKAFEDTINTISKRDCLIVPKEGVENLCIGLKGVLDLINRLQAEIKRLQNAKEMFDYLNKSVHFYEEDNVIYETDFKTPEAKNIEIDKKLQMLCDVKVCKAEGIKEFAEKLKEKEDLIELVEYLDKYEHCKKCIHLAACDAWVRHSARIYDDFTYSVEACPYFKEMVGEDNG